MKQSQLTNEVQVEEPDAQLSSRIQIKIHNSRIDTVHKIFHG